MANALVTKIGIDGEQAYRQSLKSINLTLAETSSELKKTSAQFDENGDAEKKATADKKTLNAAIDAQKQKIGVISEVLQKTTAKYGDDSDATKRWSVEMNKAQAELSNLNVKLKDTEKGTQSFGDKIKETFSNMAKNITATDVINVCKSIGSAMQNVVNQVGQIITKSIEAGADLQNATRGVETLYGDSADTVKNYAENASKSLGISASDYMQQATNFSAALISSLGGDTEAAAKTADMAINDMADNAASMGTDISSIQSAYQGFAKQNYTMLDNLKLGYAGTKTGMEQLLADASKLSGQDYDISNLNDVYDAIHVVQQEMGVAGTAAENTAQTWDGSMSAMQAAATNLLGDLTLGEDIQQPLNDLLSTVQTFFVDNLMPMITNIFNALPTLLSTLLTDGLPTLITTLMDCVVTLFTAMADMAPELTDTILGLVDTVINTIIDNLDKLIAGGIKIVVSMAVGLVKAIPQLIAKIPVIIAAIIKAFTEVDWLDLGHQILDGIGDGFKNAGTYLWGKIKSAANSIVDKFKNFLGIHSPSTVMKDSVGVYMGEGVVEGLSEGMDGAEDAILGALPSSVKIKAQVAATGTSSLSQTISVSDLKTALSEMTIDMAEEGFAKFVSKTVTKEVFA